MAALVFTVNAQSPTFADVVIELWPEYDRPETLVIYRAELSRGTPFPAEITFQLPGYIDTLNAIAFEEGGRLFSIPPELIEQTYLDDTLLLTFSTNSPRIHLEYYDPKILTTEAQSRLLVFKFEAQYPIKSITFQVQEPLQAEDFQLTPSASSSFRDKNGITYHAFTAAGLAPNDTMQLQASYNRATSNPSAQQFAPATATINPVPEPTVNTNSTMGYLLISLGAVLLLAIGGYWWWSKQPQPATQKAALVPQQHRKKTSITAKKPAATPEQAGFCTQCGTALPVQSNFCHACGTERREL